MLNKNFALLAFAALVAFILIAGCAQKPSETGGDNATPTGGAGAGGNLSSAQESAYSQLENELANIPDDDNSTSTLENELKTS